MAHRTSGPVTVAGICHECCPTGGGGGGGTVELPCCAGVDFPTTVLLDTTGGPMYSSYPTIPAQTDIPFILTFLGATTARYDLYYPSSPYDPSLYPLGVTGFFGQELVLSGYIAFCAPSLTILGMIIQIFEIGHGLVSFAVVGSGGTSSDEFTANLLCTSPFWTAAAHFNNSGWGTVYPFPATWTLHE